MVSDIMVEYLFKVCKKFRSLLIVLMFKITFWKRLKITFFNSFEGKIHISIDSLGQISIQKNLMIRGPVYLRTFANGNLTIGKHVFLNHNCSITAMKKIQIGDNCMFGNNLVIVDHDHILSSKNDNEYVSNEIVIGDHVWCGANVTILKGVHIGDGAIIAAGAVVNKSIPSGEIWGGNPVRKIK